MQKSNHLAKISQIGRSDYRGLGSWCRPRHLHVCNVISTWLKLTDGYISDRHTTDAHMLNGNRSRASYYFTYSVRTTSSSFSSRLMHDSFCNIFFTRAQSVKRRMLLGCHENMNTQTCSPLPIVSLSGCVASGCLFFSTLVPGSGCFQITNLMGYS